MYNTFSIAQNKLERKRILEEVRLQKYLAEAGIASRRKAEGLIQQGKVKVNNKEVTELGIKIDPSKDKVEYQGKIVTIQKDKVYILLNKPIGYVTTAKDQFNRESVLDLVKTNKRLVPVRKIRYVYFWCINSYQ